ncbi:hypothetical protein GUJ93_ZPchr0005g16204 [Zizania palustris]|nr:hypothetical protein GUJ93_ZPchr0005g16204 [Zizania palustris]
MRIAGRFKPCVHMGCFDLETFVELNQRSRKWQCPICLKNYSLESLMIDPYFNRITSLLRNCNEDVNEVDVKPDGSWRVKGDAATRELSQWHMPDGTLCNAMEDIKSAVQNVTDQKMEGTSDAQRSERALKIGIKRNPNGIWEVSSKADDKKPSVVENHIQNNIGFRTPNIVPMSSSPSGSYRDGEDQSVNQENNMHFDLSLNNGHEFDSFPFKFGQACNTEDRSQQQHNSAAVIVLSDSDEENDTMVCPPTVVYDNTTTVNGTGFPFNTNGAGFTERYQEDDGVGTSGLGLLNHNADDFENWQYSQPEQFQFLGNDANVPNTFISSHSSFGIAPNDYSLDCNVGVEEASVAPNLSVCQSNNEMLGSLVDNLALAGDDPSLQILFPSQPSVPLQEELSEHVRAPNGVQSDDWISLSLGAGGGGNEESTAADLNSQPQIPLKETVTSTNAASALLSTNIERRNEANLNPRIENIFSHPRQPRSVRPRLCLSIDTDSE